MYGLADNVLILRIACTYMNACIYLSIHTYIHTHIHTKIQTQIHSIHKNVDKNRKHVIITPYDAPAPLSLLLSSRMALEEKNQGVDWYDPLF